MNQSAISDNSLSGGNSGSQSKVDWAKDEKMYNNRFNGGGYRDGKI